MSAEMVSSSGGRGLWAEGSEVEVCIEAGDGTALTSGISVSKCACDGSAFSVPGRCWPSACVPSTLLMESFRRSSCLARSC